MSNTPSHPDFVPTVLIVDDDDDNRLSLTWLLEIAGFKTVEAATGPDALLMARGGVDLVLLDVVLPGLDGHEVCRQLRADPATAGLPVVLLSGHAAEPAERAAGLENGADVYLTKPADPVTLTAQCRTLIRARRAEQALRDSERQYRLLFEANPHPMWVYEPSTLRFLAVNDMAVERYGYSRAEFLGMTLADIRPAEDVPELLNAVKKPPPLDATGRVWPHVRKDGTVREVEIAAHDIVYDGRPARLVLALDVTERRRLEAQLRQSQKMEAVGRLAGGVAHDFNNLLTVINGYTDLLLKGAALDAGTRDSLQEVYAAGKRAAGLTRQLLVFSRRSVAVACRVDLNDVVRGLVPMLGRLIGEDIELTVRAAGGLWPIRADTGLIEQVVVNLCVNARDAMPRGGRLTVETWNAVLSGERAGEYAVLAVRDTGTGIAADVLPHIFEPFFTTKGPDRGTGLGLSTVQGIVHQFGGHLGVDSELGKGTTFRVQLPRGEAPEAPRLPVLPLRPADRAATVLIAEDDATVRALAARVLRQAGYTVLEAGRGEEALRLARDHIGTVDLLLTDVVMPGVGGHELVERLWRTNPNIRVLFTSGYMDDAVVRHGVETAKVNFLQKPYTPASLAHTVHEVLNRPVR
ncbi:Blue-light-activated protein [Gemmata obscuriglobus]|uniref:histidine kinase n=1 Tax=Gemmata obscuriglobus TaxID=114 RepID=A0A2Z3H9Z7_9BACT|nr:response regulator [Gemmata obscuriglobus]AWM37930.1 hybrid sensor histidine kinase/response regulator [Gemmata obscuriglobus]QEG29215.1 Blue-light-activated protein [Gemmata obscuriglobus]VTS08007.1 pas pac sensor hybrid histidine kinase : PAS/PAC sensor hybrid histidine kinase OS=Solibacter usitatus (strain Ellin6076) GN=Acid_5176 PE=4 SV=1: Response_reg: PAS_8: HisKA: HATPase_c: Response_reg [Gemmata obscuriglobus UQM 2246]